MEKLLTFHSTRYTGQSLLQAYNNSLPRLLSVAYPSHKWDAKQFEKRRAIAMSQAILARNLQQEFPHVDVKERARLLLE